MSRNSIFILTEKLMKIATYLLSSIIIARFGGAEVFGIYSSILAVNVILTAISALGLNSLLAKEFIRCNRKPNEIFSNAIIIRLLSVSVFFVISIPLQIFLLDISVLLSFLSSLVVLLSCSQVVDIFFESQLKNHVVVKYKLLGYAFGFLAKVLSVYFYGTALALILAHVFEMLVILTLSLFLISSERDEDVFFSSSMLDKDYCYKLIKKGAPLIFSSVAVILYMKIDQVFIANMIGVEGAGHYSAAVRLCEGLFILSAVVMPSIFPNMIKLFSHDQLSFDRLIGKIFSSFFLVGFCILVFISYFADNIISILYGSDYTESVLVLRWYCLSVPIVYIGDLFSRWLVVTDNIRLSFQRHFLGLILNILLNLILLPTMGISGAAAASVIAYTSAIIIFPLVSSKGRAFFNFVRFIK